MDPAARELPDDGGIPGLVAIREHGLAPVLSEAGIAGGRGPITVYKHHRGARCTFGADSDSGPIVVKVTGEPIEPVVALHRALVTAGLASGAPPTAAPILGADPVRRIVVTARFAGPTGTDLIGSGDGGRAGELAAAWLRAAWRAPIAIDDTRPPSATASDAGQWAATVAAHDPSLGDHAASVSRSLATTVPDPSPGVLVHGSLYPGHLFDLRGGPGLIDWDTSHQGRPEHDVGMFLAVIRKSRLGREKQPESAAGAITTLLDRVAGEVDAAAVRWFEAAFTLKFASYIVKRARAGWRERVAALVQEAADLAAGVMPPGHP